MICAKALYRFYGIELPEIPSSVLTESPTDSIDFKDLPTMISKPLQNLQKS